MSDIQTDVQLLYITVGSADDAHRIAATMVEERLAACANVLPGMRSVYRWKGRIEHDDEVVLILKTVAARVQPAIARVRELHSYECPCVLAIPVDGGNQAFLDWVRAETQPAPLADC